MNENLKHHVTVGEQPWRTYTVDVDTLTDRNATVASVSMEADVLGEHTTTAVHATGSAKRQPGDPFNTDGEQLAVGRALIALGQYMVYGVESHYGPDDQS